uniref:Kringle domain-containing protein n=1 Tax=Hucho hucho TaxID=62062 RepID=A0A4W5MCE3_9TELE
MEQGQSYQGTVSVTPSGVTCQRWDSHYLTGVYVCLSCFHHRDLRENYCRNPDGAEIPWCFTTDPNQRLSWFQVQGAAGVYCKGPQEEAGSWVQGQAEGHTQGV